MHVAAGMACTRVRGFNVRESAMAGWKGIVGEAFSAKDFDAYCHTLQWTVAPELHRSAQHGVALAGAAAEA